MGKHKLFTILFILILVVGLSGVATAANDKEKIKANDKDIEPILKEIKTEYKELKLSQKEFNKAEFKYGDAVAKTTNNIKIKTTKQKNGLKITADDVGKGGLDSHDVLVSVDDIPHFNGQFVRVEHYTDEGVLDAKWIQEVVSKDGFVLIPDVQFSSIIVDGATGTHTLELSDVDISDATISYSGIGLSSLDVELANAAEYMGYTEEGNVSTYSHYTDMVLGFGFDNNVDDFSGNNNNGTVVGTTEYDNGVFVFDGSTRIDIPDSEELRFYENDFTMNIWYNDSSFSTEYILSKGSFTSPTEWTVIGLGELWIGFRYDDVHTLYTPRPLDSNTHMLSIVRSGDDGLLYLDGELKTETVDFFMGVNFSTDLPIKAGCRYGDAVYYTGVLGEVNIYNTIAKNSSEIKQDFTKIDGTAARTTDSGTWVPVTDGTATLPLNDDGNVSAVEIMTSADSSLISDVTLTRMWTQDTLLEQESLIDGNLTVNITYTPANNATSGNLKYTPTVTNDSYEFTLISDNPNASVTSFGNMISINTGSLVAGQTFNYNVTGSVPVKSEPLVNPTFAGISFVALVSAFVGRLFWNRRQRR